jgi:hypothetical protein
MIILACVVFILCLVSSVSAECAWILWTQDSGPINYDEPWKVRGAYTTQSACTSQQKVLWDEKIKEYSYCGKKVNCQVSNELNTIYVEINPIRTKSGLLDEEYSRKVAGAEKSGKPHQTLSFGFLCLPDTVDPRELKR